MSPRNRDDLEPMVVTPAFLRELNSLLELGQEKLANRLEKLDDSLSDQEKDLLRVTFKVKGIESIVEGLTVKVEQNRLDLSTRIYDLAGTVERLTTEQPEQVQKLTQNKLAIVAFIITCVSIAVPSIIWLIQLIGSSLSGGTP